MLLEYIKILLVKVLLVLQQACLKCASGLHADVILILASHNGFHVGALYAFSPKTCLQA